MDLPLPLTDSSALLINTRASSLDLFACADRRFRAVKSLMRSLSYMDVRTAESADLNSVAEAAYLLLQEGCDLMGAMEPCQ